MKSYVDTPFMPQLLSAFAIYCSEKGIQAAVDASDVSVEPADEGKFIVKATASVILDGLTACRISHSGFADLGDNDAVCRIIISALTAALSFTGFDCANCATKSEQSAEKSKVTAESYTEADTSCLSIPEEEPINGTEDASVPAEESNPAAKYVPMNPELPGPMTLNDAYCFRIPLGSPQQGKGRTISEVMGMNPGLISWYASDAFNPDRGSKEAIKERRLLKQACAMVTEAAAV